MEGRALFGRASRTALMGRNPGTPGARPLALEGRLNRVLAAYLCATFVTRVTLLRVCHLDGVDTCAHTSVIWTSNIRTSVV
eukprot:514965-Prorocentrum_minimum.AAC.1